MSTKTNDLSYGHLGRASYDVADGSWQFRRLPGINRTLRPISKSYRALESPCKTLPPSEIKSSATRKEHIEQVVRSNPILRPAAYFLPPLAQVSDHVEECTSVSDPITSELLAFGTALNQYDASLDERAVKIVAVAGGNGGEAVRLIKLEDDGLEWENSSDIQLSAERLNETVQGSWIGKGSPVQQVCFSGVREKGGSWLAIRTLWSIIICRPTVRPSPSAHTVLDEGHNAIPGSAPTTILANPVVDLPIQRTGASLQADMSFNPWNTDQLAVIDIRGRWNIWNIVRYGRKGRNLWTIESGLIGGLSHTVDDTSRGLTLDGWGSVLWVGDASTVIVANRIAINLYAVKSYSRRMQLPDFNLTSSGDLILDIKRNPNDLTEIFILTSVRIIWLRVSRTGKTKEAQISGASQILLSVRHFRAPSDNSLQLVIDSNSQGITVLLYSRVTGLITGYCFNVSSAFQIPQSVSDPHSVRIVDLDETIGHPGDTHSPQPQKTTIRSMVVRPIDNVYFSSLTPSHITSFFSAAETWIRGIYTINSDLSVYVKPYISSEKYIPLPAASFVLLTSRALDVPPSVASDGWIVSDEPKSHTNDRAEQRLSGSRDIIYTVASTSKHNRKTRDAQWVAELMERQKSIAWKRKMPSLSTAEIKQSIRKAVDINGSGIHLLAELCSDVQPDEIDRYSKFSQEILDLAHGENPGLQAKSTNINGSELSLDVRSVLTSKTRAALQGDENCLNGLLLTGLYEKLLVFGLSDVPANVSSRVRVRLHREFGEIAVHLWLGSVGIGSGIGDIKAVDATASKFSRLEFKLPSRHKASATNFSKKGQERTPKNSESTSGSSMPAQTKAPNAAYERLSRLTSLAGQEPLSASAIGLLSHWVVGQDPGEYDWNRMQEMKDGHGQHSKKRRKGNPQRQSASATMPYANPPPSVPKVIDSSQIPDPKFNKLGQATKPKRRPGF